MRRRAFLRSVGGAGAVVLAGERSTASAIPAPFDQILVIKDPTPEQRDIATLYYPPCAVPGCGPVPDASHHYSPERTLVVPEWAIESVAYRLQQAGGGGREVAHGFLWEYAYLDEQHVMSDGRDAAQVAVERYHATRE